MTHDEDSERQKWTTKDSWVALSVILPTLLVLLGGWSALSLKVEREEAKIEAHLQNRDNHPSQDERRRIIQEEIDRGLGPVLSQLTEIKGQLEELKRTNEEIRRRAQR